MQMMMITVVNIRMEREGCCHEHFFENSPGESHFNISLKHVPLSHMAETCGVVFFNVDYRLAPEAKCPENVKDFYSALKYVVRLPQICGKAPSNM